MFDSDSASQYHQSDSIYIHFIILLLHKVLPFEIESQSL